VSVALAGIIAERMGARATISAGLILVGGSMLLIGQSQGYFAILALYTITGFGSGIANVSLMGLVAHWFDRKIRARAAGLMISGNGLAIVFAGIYVPFLNSHLGAQGWRKGWLTMGLMAMIVAVAAAALMRNNPADKGLFPMGSANRPTADTPARHGSKLKRSMHAVLLHLGAIYTLFGATYVVYATFIVTTMVNEKGYAENVAGTFWALVGGLSIFSGPLFGWAADKFGRRIGMVSVFAAFTLSYTLAAAKLPDMFLYLSIVLYGLSAWSIPTIMAAAVGDYMGPAKAAKAFGWVTVFFSIGQVVGPATAGYLADAVGTFRIAFWMCAGLTALAAALAFYLKRPAEIS